MKKINLRGLSEILSVKELKSTIGGSETGGNCCIKCSNGALANLGPKPCNYDLFAEFCPFGGFIWDC